jgi:glycosyltransferase involved in cell wall biosynthesis
LRRTGDEASDTFRDQPERHPIMADLSVSTNAAAKAAVPKEISDPSVMAVQPAVSILMLAYNHGPYIADGIEGVVLQKTDFPIELIIGEDCSTDNTRDIVLEYQQRYPQLIRVIYSDRNVGAKQNDRRIHEAARAKFIAYCEGDDVWIDDQKLRKQLGVMESEPDCTIVFHAAEIFEVRKKTVKIRHYGSRMKTFSLDEVILAHPRLMTTASVMVRRSAMVPTPGWLTVCEVGDYPMMVLCASRGKVIYLPDVMSRYRVYIPGSWSVHSSAMEPRRKIVDSIIRMPDGFLLERGEEASRTVRKAQRKFIMMWLFLGKNDHPLLTEEDRRRYMSYLTWKDRGLIWFTKAYASRRMVKLALEAREYVQRRLSGRRLAAK